MNLILKNRYVVVEQIGRGGMAEIFRALIKGPHGFEKEVCIKRILPHLSDHPGFEAMFLDEARIAATMQHAGIVQVFDFDRDEDGNYFIVMELVDGVNLKTVCLRAREKGRRLDAGFTVAIAGAVLHALHYAWTKNVEGRSLQVVHRDLSPQNILVSRGGEVKITDFGIAKAVTSAVRTRAGIIKGKLAYMSPEQAAGKKADPRSDLYALGVVLWELLAGRRLFKRASDEKTRPTADERSNVEEPGSQRKDIPKAFESFVESLLEVDPRKRPQSAIEALDLLEKTGARSLSPIRVGELIGELGCFQQGAGGRAAGEVSAEKKGGKKAEEGSSSLSPPGSGSTLKPMSTYSTATLYRTAGERNGKHFFPGFFPVLIVLGVLLAAGVLYLSLQITGKEKDGGGLPRTAAGEKEDECGSGDTPKPDGEGENKGAEPEVLKEAAAVHEAPALSGAGHDSGGEKGGEKKIAKGWVSINVRPWAEVIIDGRKLGYTPVRRHKLQAGVHRIVLKNPKLGMEKKMKVTVAQKQGKDIFFDFTAEKMKMTE